MAVHVDPKSRIFKVDYKAPFGGLDSTAYASAIAEQNFADTDGFYIEDNIIKPVGFNLLGSLNEPTEIIYGYIPYRNNLSGILSTYPVGYVITSATVYEVSISSSGLACSPLTTYTPALPLDALGFNYLIINTAQAGGRPTIYWTMYRWTEIWQFQYGTGASQLTGYCGGGVLGLLNNQFLNLGGYSAADGYTPNRISWSAPGEYGQFQPYDVGSGTGNYAAGFNDLPSTSDILTGFSAIGTIGYLFRQQGITQMSPTGNGIVPFSFNHLWASEMGIGTPYPNTVAQYGSIVCFISDNGIYSLGLGGLNELGTNARSAIFKALNSSNQSDKAITLDFTSIIQAQIVPYGLDSPDTLYFVMLDSSTDTTDSKYQFFGISLTNNRVLDFGDITVTGFNLFITLPSLSYFQSLKTNLSEPITGLPLLSSQTKLLAMVICDNTLLNFYGFDLNNTITGTVTFRKEQFGLLQQPTVSKLLVLGSLIDTSTNGTISWSIDGGLTFNTAFADTVITAGSGNPGNGIIDDIVADGVQTLERPQLVLKLTNVQIAEAYYQGTFADYEPI